MLTDERPSKFHNQLLK